MKIKKCFTQVLELSKIKINEYSFKIVNRTAAKHFSRESKMGFQKTLLFMMNMVKKTLQVEINSFFQTVLKKDEAVSKQAYSDARQKIKPEAFIELNDTICAAIYENPDDYERWNGYRLSAIDASILEIPNTELLRKEFGFVENQSIKDAKATAAFIYDVLNRIVIKSKIDKYGLSEREIAKDLISKLVNDSIKQDLILFDRGYPSADFMAFLFENGIDFVIRTPGNFSKAINNAKKPDQIIDIKNNGKTYKVRVLRFLLTSGIEEVLLTSLMDTGLTIEDFKQLYFKRWGIEIKFDDIKNILEIENFTGNTKIAIEQDFYASMYLMNMAELARQQSNEIIETRQENNNLKHEYKTNMNVLIGTLKDKFVMMLLEESKRKRNKMFMSVVNTISKSVTPIRPGRQNERKEKKSAIKYKINRKRAL